MTQYTLLVDDLLKKQQEEGAEVILLSRQALLDAQTFVYNQRGGRKLTLEDVLFGVQGEEADNVE